MKKQCSCRGVLHGIPAWTFCVHCMSGTPGWDSWMGLCCLGFLPGSPALDSCIGCLHCVWHSCTGFLYGTLARASCLGCLFYIPACVRAWFQTFLLSLRGTEREKKMEPISAILKTLIFGERFFIACRPLHSFWADPPGPLWVNHRRRPDHPQRSSPFARIPHGGRGRALNSQEGGRGRTLSQRQ